MDPVEDIKDRLNIEDVVAEYVELKRAGRNFKGMSPFSAEKTPSFVVSPEKGIWHDFSSGKGGTMFSFVMEMEGLDFKGALELLARKAGVDLAQYGRGGGNGDSGFKERLYAVNQLAAKFYQVQFSKNKLALEYVLGKRKFSKQTALEWQLGYSPNTGKALVDFLSSKGFTEKEIKTAGLSSSRYRGLADMFRGRLMIPLQDQMGRVIGFTARLLTDDPQAPKYINTPQSPLYDKSRHVYGLHLAKEAIRKTKYVVLVEGNLDVISSHQAGVRQVVATAGTAMTEQHLKALSKFTGDIRLSFDQDKAGINATERAIPIASKVGVSLSMITIPSGKDPDELIKQDATIWKQVIEQHQYALDWLIERYKTLLDVESAGADGKSKREFSDVLLPVVRQLQDSVERDHYLQEIASIIGVSQEALLDKYQKTTKPVAPRLRRSVSLPPLTDKQTAERTKMQDHLLALALMQPSLRGYLNRITPDMLFSDEARQLLAFLQHNQDFTGQEALRPIADYCKIVSIQYEELYQGLEIPELQNEAARQQTRLIEQYVKTEKLAIRSKLRESADDATMRRLLEQAKALDKLLT